jgi:hypothetical protein
LPVGSIAAELTAVRDCRQIVASDWYRALFPTRLSPQALP